MNDFYRHKKSDKIKWVLTGIAFVLVAVMLTGICLQLFGTGKQKPSNWFTKTECEHVYNESGKCEKCGKDKPEDKENLPVLDESGNELANGAVCNLPQSMIFRTAKSLMSATPSTQAESDYTRVTVRATVLPEDLEDKSVDAVLSFKDSNSTWASGKNVTDYFSVTQATDGSTEMTLNCLQPFGEPILLRVSSREDSTKSDICQIDFAKRVTGANVEIVSQLGVLSPVNNVLSLGTTWNQQYDTAAFRVLLSYSVGTIEDDFTISAQMAYTPAYLSALKSNGFDKTVPPYPFSVKDLSFVNPTLVAAYALGTDYFNKTTGAISDYNSYIYALRSMNNAPIAGVIVGVQGTYSSNNNVSSISIIYPVSACKTVVESVKLDTETVIV